MVILSSLFDSHSRAPYYVDWTVLNAQGSHLSFVPCNALISRVSLIKIDKSITTYLGIQFGVDFSTSQVAKSFIGTGLTPAPGALPPRSAIAALVRLAHALRPSPCVTKTLARAPDTRESLWLQRPLFPPRTDAKCASRFKPSGISLCLFRMFPPSKDKHYQSRWLPN